MNKDDSESWHFEFAFCINFNEFALHLHFFYIDLTRMALSH